MTSEEKLYELLSSAKPTAPTEGSIMSQEIAKASPDATTPLTIRNLFTHHDAHPVVLDFALLRTFGLEWMEWEAETLWAEIHRIFKSQISELARAKIQSVKTCHLSSLPWEKWQVFEKVIQGLNNNVPRFDLMQAPTLEQLMSGVDILTTIRKEDFSDEVRAYAAAAVLHEDVIFVPSPLDFIQAEISQPHFRCKDCGNEMPALFHDGVCDSCAQKWQDDMGGGPSEDAKKKGQNIEVSLRFDPDPTEALWKQVEHKPVSEVESLLEETPEGTQVAKLLIARDYMNVRRRQLADQLTALKTWLGASA